MNSPAPHSTAPGARLYLADEDVFVLAGALMAQGGPEDPALVVFWEDQAREYEAPFWYVFDFFRTPRTKTQANEWLKWAGVPEDIFDALIGTRAIVRVNTEDVRTAVESLRGIRVSAACVLDSAPPTALGLVGVKASEDAPVGYDIPAELADALFGQPDVIDIPTVVERVRRRFDERFDSAASAVLLDLPRLLRAGFVVLSWSEAPRV